MKNTARLLAEHSQNNVVLLSTIKKANGWLYRAYLDNQKAVDDALLKHYDSEVCDDVTHRSSDKKVRTMIRYLYGDKVNLTDLRTEHWSLYLNLCGIGNPRAVLRSWGFDVCFSSTFTEETLKQELERRVASDGWLELDPKTYDAVKYRAKRKGLTMQEYLENLGFRYSPTNRVDEEAIVIARLEGKTYRAIAKEYGVPKSTVFDIVQRHLRGDAIDTSRKS